MTDYGGFQIVRELNDDGLVTTYEAQREGGDASASYHLQVYRPPPTILGSPGAALEAVRFLETGRRLQEASLDAAGLVDVHALGVQDGGAYLVTSGFPYTFQSLIDAKVHLTANLLRYLIAQVIRSVLEYQSKTGSAHGNLIASSVYLDTLSDLERAGVRLTNPTFSPEVGSEADPFEDHRALGRLIHALVEFRPAWAPVRWPFPSSDPWNALGRSGEKWRELTNRLLDPNAAQAVEVIDLTRLIHELPIEPRNYRKIAGLSTAAVLTIALSSVMYWKFIYDPLITQQQLEPLQANIVIVCEEHTTWLIEFLGEAGDQPFVKFEGQSPLVEHIDLLRATVVDKLLEAAGTDDYFQSGNFFPLELGGDRWNWALVLSHSQGGGADLSVFTQSQFDEIESIALLIGQVKENARNWQRERLTEQVKWLDQRGWLKASREHRSKLGSEDDPPNFTRIRILLEAESQLAAIENLWQPIEQVHKEAPGKGERALSQFQPTLEQHLSAQSNLRSIHEALNDIPDLVSHLVEVATDEGKRIHWDLVEQEILDPPAWSLGAFQDWSNALRAYYKFESQYPVNEFLYTENIQVLQGSIESLRGCAADEKASYYELNRVSLVRSHEIVITEPYIQKNRLRIEEAELELSGLGDLREESELAVGELCETPREYYDRITTKITFQSPSLANAWSQKVRSANPLQAMPREDIPKEDLHTYLGIRRPLDGTIRVFEHLDQVALRVEAIDGVSKEIAPLPPATEGWSRDRAMQVIRRRRERAIEIVMQRVIEMDSTPSLDSPSIANELAEQERQFSEWYAVSDRLIGDYLEIERRLDLAYGLDDIEPSETRSIANIETQWTDTQSGTDEYHRLFAPSLSGITSRIETLREIRNVSSATRVQSILSRQAVQDRPEQYLAAWKSLETLLAAGDHDRLADDHQILLQIKGWLAALDDSPDRRADLTRRLDDEAHDRWESHMKRRSTPQEDADLEAYEEDLDRHRDFQVRLRDLSEWLRWNLELHVFRKSMQALEDVDEHEAQARVVIQDYQSGLSRYGAAISGEESIREMMVSLDLIRRDEQKTVDFNEIGPAARNPDFKYVPIPGAVNPIRPNGPPKLISYKFDGKTDAQDIELVFVLLDSRIHDGLSEPVYMCANEVSLKTFFKISLRQEHIEQLNKVLYLKIGGDDTRRVRVWQRHDQTTIAHPVLIPAENEESNWIFIDTRRQSQNFPNDAGPRSEPLLDHPVQHISPFTAMYIASALGCRLPTTAEFHAALVEEYDIPTVDQILPNLLNGRQDKPFPNLSDIRLQRQYVFSKNVERDLELRKAFSPELGSFFTWPDNNRTFEDLNGRYFFENLNDRVLFFDTVHTPGYRYFQHLIGNVMEWVYDAPEDLDFLEEGTIPGPRELVGRVDATRIGVIGGSAFSPPSMPPHERQPLKTERRAPSDLLKYQCTDVGFRLVIAGQFDTVAQQVLAATKLGYLNPPS